MTSKQDPSGAVSALLPKLELLGVGPEAHRGMTKLAATAMSQKGHIKGALLAAFYRCENRELPYAVGEQK